MREMDYEDECDRVFKEYGKLYTIQRYNDSPPHVSLTNHESRITNHELRTASFVSQRLDRIEVGRFESGVSTENDSDDRAAQEAEDDPVQGDDRRHFEKKRGCIPAEYSERNPDHGAHFTP